MDDATLIDLLAEQTYDLRRQVLRAGTPSTDVEWAGDDLDTTLHLGVVEVNAVVAISTWLASPSPDLDPHHVGVQLRGMATDPAMRGHGFGAMLLRAGIERARQSGADHVWANARSAALDFYVGHGFEITSGEFDNAETAIPHRRILLRLPRPATAAPLEG
jgi:predicted GNAT family N-acyltransferase